MLSMPRNGSWEIVDAMTPVLGSKDARFDLLNFQFHRYRFLRRNGEFVLGGHTIESYDINTGRQRTIVTKKPWLAMDYLIDYVESLVLLEQTSKQLKLPTGR
ncbi:hypothetical protein Droror1_Dr00019236 [Drosera rotundifolia]